MNGANSGGRSDGALPKVIVLGVDSPIGLTIIRELGRKGVPVHAIGGSLQSLGRASRYCSSFSIRDRRNFDLWLPDLIASTGAKGVMAISESDLLQLAKLPPIIGDCQIMTPRMPQLEAVLDKRRTLEIAQTVGINVPRNFVGTPHCWPVVLKWSDPNVIMDELDAAGLEFLKTEYCQDLDCLSAALARYRNLSMQPLVQEFVAGYGLGQMFHFENGRPTLFFQHQRLHEWPPEGGVSTLCRSLPVDQHQSQRALSERLLVEMGWDGPAMVEYRYDPINDRYALMEINGRFWGSQPLASYAGATFAWELYRRRILHDQSVSEPYLAYIQARYMVPESKRLVRLFAQGWKVEKLAHRPTKWRDLWMFVRDFFNPRSYYYVFSRDDPKPFFSDMVSIFRKALRLDKAMLDDPPPFLSAQNNDGNRPAKG